MEHTKPDIEIIKEICAGSKNAFNLLYKRYARKHMLTCLRYVKNRADAEDLLQEAYIKIYRDLKQFDPQKSQFSTWSNRVVINTCLMKLRKKSIFTSIENLKEIGKEIKVDPDALEKLNLRELTTIISELPRGYRTVFNMFVIDGYSQKEISETLGISVSTSKTQLLKAKKTLQNNINTKDIFKSILLC